MATEQRLIDADVAIERAKQSDKIVRSSIWETGEVVEFLEDEPIVDAVPVVRCRDCKHWYEAEGVCLKIYSDGAVSAYAWQYRHADDFCSYGERKDND